MSTPPSLALKREDLKDADGEWVEKLTRALVSFGRQTQDAFDRNVSILGNLNATRKTLDITTKDDWIAPTLINSWVNFGAATGPVAGYRKRHGCVEIKGLLKSGTPPSVAFVLPSGYLSPYNIRRASTGNGAFADLYLNASTGDFYIYAGSTLNTTIDCIFQALDPTPFPNPIFPVVFKHGLKGTARPLAVLAIDVLDVTNSASGQHVSTTVSWSPSGDSVRIKDLPGLEPNRRYKVTFLVLGE